jgi:hypothetical protein
MSYLKLSILIAAWLLPIAAAKYAPRIVRHFRRENAKLTRLVDLDGPR